VTPEDACMIELLRLERFYKKAFWECFVVVDGEPQLNLLSRQPKQREQSKICECGSDHD